MKLKYALVDGVNTEAQPGLSTKCQICEKTLVAKCGKIRVWHWAHIGKLTCDPWWENKTDWHKAWQAKFPPEWQELPQFDQQTNEKHIADVRTSYGLVIEFQRSHIDPKEREARERFYKKMVWVVDGTRLVKDFPRFESGLGDLLVRKEGDNYFLPNPEKCLPTEWLNSPVEVFFDFLGVGLDTAPDSLRQPLWFLRPGRTNGTAVVTRITRENFLSIALNGPQQRQVPVQQPQNINVRVPIDMRFLKQFAPDLYREVMRPPQRRQFRRF